MKTKEQILKWLDEQPWADEFYREVFMLRTNLNLSYDESFISMAFCWDKTEQGEEWITRDKKFRQWYNSNDKPLSWEEYCRQNPIKAGDGYIDEISDINSFDASRYRDEDEDVNVMPEYLCNAFLAYMKLIQLRNAWVKDYENCGNNVEYLKIVYTEERGFYTVYLGKTGLSFPKSSMAEEFINTFKDLLEIAKPLI